VTFDFYSVRSRRDVAAGEYGAVSGHVASTGRQMQPSHHY